MESLRYVLSRFLQSLFALLCIGITLAGLGASGQLLVQGYTRTTLSLLTLALYLLPLLGAITPATFVPLAEESGLIVPIGRWVIDEACRQLASWRRQGLDGIRVAVNLSVRQTRDDMLPGFIDDTLRRTGVPAHCLELEVTESMLMEDTDAAVSQLARLRARGLQLAIDDFGTGYSSLAYLKRLPIDVIKLDRCFVGGLPDDPYDLAIVQAVASLAQRIGLDVVAEGVETKAQVQTLRECGVERAQGYLFSAAVENDELVERFGS